jgi:2-keto-4-pentenoate hydratase
MDGVQAPVQAGKILFRAWQEGEVINNLPNSCRPLSRTEGYQVQQFFEMHSGHALRGWKIAATSTAGQKHIGVSGPIAGRLLQERCHSSGAELSLTNNRMAVAEPEFAFCMGKDLIPRSDVYSLPEILTAVAELHPAIEVPDSRFADFTKVGEAQLIADNACAHEFVLGPVAPEYWRSLDLSAHRVSARLDRASETILREGSGFAVLGSPLRALMWLVNELSSLGVPLRRGQIVTTGACMQPLDVQAGDKVIADFGSIGTVSVNFQI